MNPFVSALGSGFGSGAAALIMGALASRMHGIRDPGAVSMATGNAFEAGWSTAQKANLARDAQVAEFDQARRLASQKFDYDMALREYQLQREVEGQKSLRALDYDYRREELAKEAILRQAFLQFSNREAISQLQRLLAHEEAKYIDKPGFSRLADWLADITMGRRWWSDVAKGAAPWLLQEPLKGE